MYSNLFIYSQKHQEVFLVLLVLLVLHSNLIIYLYIFITINSLRNFIKKNNNVNKILNLFFHSDIGLPGDPGYSGPYGLNGIKGIKGKF